jgi:4-oxalocrotonate tautomerase
MPFIRITASGSTLAPEQILRLQTEMTELMSSVLGKKANLTSVLVEQPAVAGWAIGGFTARVAVHVDATITAGTNSPEEKARFIEQTMKLLKHVFGGELNPATYVVLAEVPAQSWGYDGRTQESRRQAA